MPESHSAALSKDPAEISGNGVEKSIRSIRVPRLRDLAGGGDDLIDILLRDFEMRVELRHARLQALHLLDKAAHFRLDDMRFFPHPRVADNRLHDLHAIMSRDGETMIMRLLYAF